MEKRIRYFISGMWTREGVVGHANFQIESNVVTSLEDVIEMQNLIKEKNDFDDMVILNYAPFKNQ